MKARQVKGLDPDRSLGRSVERVVRSRVEELYSFVPAALEPGETVALHDMRIAAKRLRYILELTGPCFGAEAIGSAKEAKRLQTLLGDIHDCDEMLEQLAQTVERLRREDVAAVCESVDARASDLEPQAVKAAPNRRRYRGLEALATYLRARREVLHERFLRRWAQFEREGFRARVEEAVA